MNGHVDLDEEEPPVVLRRNSRQMKFTQRGSSLKRKTPQQVGPRSAERLRLFRSPGLATLAAAGAFGRPRPTRAAAKGLNRQPTAVRRRLSTLDVVGETTAAYISSFIVMSARPTILKSSRHSEHPVDFVASFDICTM